MYRLLRIEALTLPLLAATACSDEAPCSHRVCNAQDPGCAEFAAQVIACQRDSPVALPSVRVSTAADYLAQFDPPTPEALDEARDYWAGEALVGLMPHGYDPANSAADSFQFVAALYSWLDDEIVLISDSGIDDPKAAYRVLVHELVHAQQHAEHDLEALWQEYATTFPRDLGFRAAIEGEATLFTTLADIELDDVRPGQVDWDDYFVRYQADVLAAAQETEVPSLDARSLFPYAFGVEQAFYAWEYGGIDGVHDYVSHPPDSVRQVMAGYSERPPEVFNGDTALAPRAVPVVPGHTFLNGGPQGLWLINAMLHRTASVLTAWPTQLQTIEADYLSVWRNDETGERVAVWRLVGGAAVVGDLLTRAGSQWVESPEAATTHHLSSLEGDWVLVATETSAAPAVLDTITEWQSRDQADGVETLTRARGPSDLLLPNHVIR